MTIPRPQEWYRQQAVQAGFDVKSAMLEAYQCRESPRLAVSREWWVYTGARRAAHFASLVLLLERTGCESLEELEAEWRTTQEQLADQIWETTGLRAELTRLRALAGHME